MSNILDYINKVFFIIQTHNLKKILFLLILILGGAILETFGIAIIIPIIKLIVSGREYFLSLETIKDNVFLLNFFKESSFIELMLFVISSIFIFFSFKFIFILNLIWQQHKFSANLMSEISQRLFKNYMHQPYSFHLKNNSSKLIHNITSEVNLLSSSVVLPLSTLVSEILVLISVFILLLIIETKVVIIITFFLFIVSSFFYLITKKSLITWGYARQDHDSQRFKHLQQGLGGIKDIKLLGREDEFLKEFSTNTEELKKTAIKTGFISMVPRIGLEYLSILTISIILLIATIYDYEKEAIITSLAVFTAAAFRIMPSVNRIIANLQSLAHSLPVTERLYIEFFNETKNANHNKVLKNIFSQEINFKNVSFSYDGKNEVLKHISFNIKKGSSIGIVGRSGSGKTTLIDLMLGLLDPVEGIIEIDQFNLKSYKKEWQSNIGYVPQNIYLSDDSLRRNIAFGINEKLIDDQKIKKALEAANLSKFIASLDEGIHTNVGERGVRISGGQLQRIGIARSLYHNPDVLILDEATSSLDVETEKKIILEVNNLKKSKTIIFISHRLSAIESCDYLIKLEKGKIIDFGRPNLVIN